MTDVNEVRVGPGDVDEAYQVLTQIAFSFDYPAKPPEVPHTVVVIDDPAALLVEFALRAGEPLTDVACWGRKNGVRMVLRMPISGYVGWSRDGLRDIALTQVPEDIRNAVRNGWVTLEVVQREDPQS